MKIKNPVLKLTSLAVFTAIAILIVLQYRWAVSSGEKSIRDLAQTNTFRIVAIVSQELSHLDLFDISPKPREEEIIFTNDLQKSLEDMWIQFQDNYSEDYILGISYFLENDTENGFFFDSNEWTTKTFSLSALRKNKYENREEFKDFRILHDPDNPGQIQMLRFIPGINAQVFIDFKLKDFLELEILPRVNESFTNSTLIWQDTKPEKGIELNERDYRFSPISTLVNFLTSQEVDYYITIPYFRIPFTRFFRDGQSKFFNPLEEEMIYLKITTDSGKSLYVDRELDFAIQWLTGLILLLGIGGAYSLILYQKNRLSRLREREKEFVASITHELRTPLTVINSAADNIQSGILSKDRLLQYGDLIKDQSKRLATMIEGILLFSRLEGKAEQTAPNNLLIYQDLKEDLEVFSSSLNGDENLVSIDFGALPTNSYTDRETLELVLTNLINNSFNHAYEKDAKKSIRVFGHLSLPKTLIFTVEDDGSGIPNKEKKKIFEPFFRGNRSLNEQIKGSGLGLYLVNRKIKLMGGSISLESPYLRADGKMRQGCRFTVKVPYYEPAKEES